MCSGDFLTKKFILDKPCSIFCSLSQHFEVSFDLVPPAMPRRQRHIAVWPHQPQAVSLKGRAQTRLQEIGIFLNQRRPSVHHLHPHTERTVAYLRLRRRIINVDRSTFTFLGARPRDTRRRRSTGSPDNRSKPPSVHLPSLLHRR